MRIRGFCKPGQPALKFDDLRVGDVLTFPKNPGWCKHVFIIVWTTAIYNKKYGDIDSHTLIRLDGRPKEDNCWITSEPQAKVEADRATAGQSYTLGRKMMECGVETRDGPDRYFPKRWNATVTLEEEY